MKDFLQDRLTLAMAITASLLLSAGVIRRLSPARQVLDRPVSRTGLPPRLVSADVQVWVQRGCGECDEWLAVARRGIPAGTRTLVVRQLPSLDTTRTASPAPPPKDAADSAVALAEAIAVADADLLDISSAPAILAGSRLLLRARDSVAVRKWLVNALTQPVP